MTATIDITETAIVKALGDFISGVVSCPVLRSQVNRVSMPVGDFIMMTPVHRLALATNVDTYTDPNKLIRRSTQVDIQIDCYGQLAGDRAQMLATLLRDDYACAQMVGVQPLYAGDAHQMPLITGEEQYLERWTFEASLQANPTVTVPQDFMDTADIGLVDVDAKYPPT